MSESCTVCNLSTGETREYVGIKRDEALVAAYAQSKGDYNTWDYKKYFNKIVSGKYTMAIEDWCILKNNK